MASVNASEIEENKEEEEKESSHDDAYDLQVVGWGRNENELLNDYGVVLNHVNGFSQEIIDNDQLSVFYVFDSN